jgi:hypothetical protein
MEQVATRIIARRTQTGASSTQGITIPMITEDLITEEEILIGEITEEEIIEEIIGEITILIIEAIIEEIIEEITEVMVAMVGVMVSVMVITKAVMVTIMDLVLAEVIGVVIGRVQIGGVNEVTMIIAQAGTARRMITEIIKETIPKVVKVIKGITETATIEMRIAVTIAVATILPAREIMLGIMVMMGTLISIQ